MHLSNSPYLQNTYVNVNHIMTVAKRLLETGNYGRQQIQNVATRLEQDWQLFSKALDTRGAVLNLSVNFHYKANMVVALVLIAYLYEIVFLLLFACHCDRLNL